MNTVNLVVRVPETLRQQAKAFAALRGDTLSDIVRDALASYVGSEETRGENLAVETKARIAEAGPIYFASGMEAVLVNSVVTEEQILKALHVLARDRWFEVLDFIDYLRQRRPQAAPQRSQLSARELAESDLVGLWADREDMADTLEYARQLRYQAEHRWGDVDAAT